MSDLTSRCRTALTRARWAVIQTGLITTGLALFGVYVLANRINEEHVMSFYVLRYVPLGPWLVGTIAGIGYGVAAWWMGVPVRRWLLLAILALQCGAYFLGHYVDLQSLGLIYRDTREPVGFIDFFHVSTLNLAAHLTNRDLDERSAARLGYMFRAIELLVFLFPAATASLMLVGTPRCAACRGGVKEQQIGTINPAQLPGSLPRLEHFARSGNKESFIRLLTPPGGNDTKDEIPLLLCRCKACGSATIKFIKRDLVRRRNAPPLHVLCVSDAFAELIAPTPAGVAKAM